ncbi:InlB B-repeat-containing protein [Lachnospira multipara]|uniref:InlB B-repeat-containing protein n=1 Tax=Lachnospira multipara TaxID=28051 RepID=UPI0012DD2B73|nr:hypothetical protein [Lachnospira multipara]
MSSGIYGNGEEILFEPTSDVDNRGTIIVADGYGIKVSEGANVNILNPGKISFYPAANNTGTITAVPADGYAFAGWYNGENLYSNNAELEYKNISEDLDLTAQFASTALTPVVSDFIYSAPSDLTYDGNAKTATVVPKEGINGMGDVTVKYYSDAACTTEVEDTSSVGIYYVGITVAEGDNYNAITSVLHDENWMFTIGKASATADSSDSGSSSSSSGSTDNTNTNTDTSAKVPYNDVAISTGSVNDITGTAAATAESNPFETKIENNDNLTTLLALTPEEVAQGVNVWLDIQDMSATVPQADKDLVQNASTNLTVGMYLDINLFKKVGDNAATKVTETNGIVKASILIPESLWKAGRTFEIIRVHDGVATAIEGTYDENIHVFTFETDKFSTYALAYKDSASSSGSDTTSDSGSSNSSNSTQSTAPKTGDPNDIRVWYLLLLASLGGLGFLGLSKKKKVND